MPAEVLAPPLGTNVDTLLLAEWHRREGAVIRVGDPLFAVETDKATLDVESPASGTLGRILVPAGSDVPSLTRVAWILLPGETTADIPPDATPEATDEPALATGAPATAAESMLPRGDRVFISPRARRLAETEGVAWELVAPTGPEGAVIERDIRAALAARGDESGLLERLPLDGIRGVIARRMAESAASVAPVTLTTEADATHLVEHRAALAEQGIRVSFNDLLLHLLAGVLPRHPRLNASLRGEHIHVWKEVHLGLAVDTDRGLMAPVLRNADCKTLVEIAAETRGLIASARAGTLRLEALRGATFTLTNLGMFGIDAFTPIVNLPECAILGVGRIKEVPAVVDGRIEIRRRMWLSLTFDHRLIDGGLAARFLQDLVHHIESRREHVVAIT